jgi:hypothetical protein
MVSSYRTIPVAPGNALVAKLDGYFTTGVANSEQVLGLIDRAQGCAFGYDGATFGVLHRVGGSFEIRSLQITTKSTTAENITITLDGDSDATVAVTDATATDATTTANEIAAHDYSDLGKGWDAIAIGDTVYFVSWSAEVQTGSYSITATTAAGTYTQEVAGVVPTDTWTPQASWNGKDKFDGSGLSGVTLDPTKGIVYQIRYQAGFGGIQFYVSDPDDQEMHLVHTIENGNVSNSVHAYNATYRIAAISSNDANTSNLTVGCSFMSIFTEGRSVLDGPRYAASGTNTSVATTLIPVLSIYNKEVFQSSDNRTAVKIVRADVAVEHTKPMILEFWKNTTLTGAAFSDVDADSMVESDTTATAMTGGEFLFSIPLGKASSVDVSFDDEFEGLIEPGDVITAGARTTSGTGGEADVSLRWVELI